jgi:hypothetical protein
MALPPAEGNTNCGIFSCYRERKGEGLTEITVK